LIEGLVQNHIKYLSGGGIMEFKHEKGRVYMENQEGKLIAEITFPATAPGVVNIDHTFVDDSLRGQGMADKLVRAALADIAKDGEKYTATCSYAVKWLEKHQK
jgi:predicted GNAT family acetyltransferase